MNSRERFWKAMNFEKVDKLPNWSDWIGPWRTWRHQGLPIEVPEGIDEETYDTNEWFVNFFGTEGMYSAFWGTSRVPVDIAVNPPFEEIILEETDHYRIRRQGNGVIVKQFNDTESNLHSTHFVEYPIKNRADWVRFRDEHLDPHAPGRYPAPAEWEALKAKWKNRDYVISIDGGSFYGLLRDWMGFEALSFLVYDEPKLVQEMMDYLGDFFIEVLRKAVTEIPDIDFAMFWEDMCYKTGPLLSPRHFRQWMLPNYKKVTNFLVDHGVKLSWVDCDGNIEALLPLWVEGGVTGFYPLEVAADMDAVKLRKQYGKQSVMWVNVDKRTLAKGKEAIDAELARLAPIVGEGGFIPLVDHGVPSDVPYENYLYYLQQRLKLTGWG